MLLATAARPHWPPLTFRSTSTSGAKWPSAARQSRLMINERAFYSTAAATTTTSGLFLATSCWLARRAIAPSIVHQCAPTRTTTGSGPASGQWPRSWPGGSRQHPARLVPLEPSVRRIGAASRADWRVSQACANLAPFTWLEPKLGSCFSYHYSPVSSSAERAAGRWSCRSADNDNKWLSGRSCI